jgi:hypothetical protein
MKEVYKGMLMSVAQVRRKCISGVRMIAHVPFASFGGARSNQVAFRQVDMK